MFLMDVLRHTGAARMAEFVGNTPGNVAMDQEQLRSAYYTPAEANAQIQKAADRCRRGRTEADRRRRLLRRGHQPGPEGPLPDRRGADLPGGVRRAAEDADRLDPGRHRLHRLAGGRHLRQGRWPRDREREVVAGAQGQVRQEAGAAHLRRPPREERPRGADHVEQEGAVRRRRLQPRPARCRAARPRRRHRSRDRHRGARHRRPGAGDGPAQHRPAERRLGRPLAARRPRDEQRPPGHGQEVRHRPAAGGDGAADRLLRAAAARRAGAQRTGHPGPRRRLRGHQPVRPARARPRLRLVGHLGRQRQHRHRRREAVQHQRLEGHGQLDRLPGGQELRADGRPGAQRDDHART